MASRRQREMFKELNANELRATLLHLASVAPEVKDMCIEYLSQQQDKRRRTASLSLNHLLRVSSSSKKKQDIVVGSINEHIFHPYNYTKPTKCAHCNKLLVGLVRQGQQCQLCLANAHKNCVPYLPKCVVGQRRRSRRKSDAQSKKSSPGSRRRSSASTVAGAAQEADHSRRPSRLTAGGLQESSSTDVVHLQVPDGRPFGNNGDVEGDSTDLADGESEDYVDCEGDQSWSDSESNSSSGQSGSSDGEEDNDEQSSPEGLDHDMSVVVEAGSHGTDVVVVEDELKEDEDVMSRRRFRRHWTGVKANWRKHTDSFRRRLMASKKMDPNKILRELQDENHLNHEFNNIPTNQASEKKMPRMTDHKNRYFNILPNNPCRVVLEQVGDDETSSYINASWMSGYNEASETYIAAQGPLDHTVADFWRMVWQVSASVIVMNTDLEEGGKEKCVRYWPDSINKSKSHGGLTVSLVEEKKAEYYIISRLKLTKESSGQSREITHLWWPRWPDQGVPEETSAVFEFILAARKLRQKHGGPGVVHCSAGVGRTGCIIAIDIGMQQWDNDGHVDVLATVCKMRQERGFSVQTAVQYRFIHQMLYNYMVANPKIQADAMHEDSATADSGPGTRMSIRKGADGRPLLVPSARVPLGAAGSDNSQQESDEANEHAFNTRTYVRDTECSICGELLEGLAQQGLRCRFCKMNVHHYCLEEVTGTCVLVVSHNRRPSGLPVWPPPKPEDGAQRPIARRRRSHHHHHRHHRARASARPSMVPEGKEREPALIEHQEPKTS